MGHLDRNMQEIIIKEFVWNTFCLGMAAEITRIDNVGNRDQPCIKQGEVQV